ncbi:hypothetical protein [Chitiniphilus shinanonensis]|uniref:hypothetical protein n=1 Tax=Chitiniphilus shinanonensis TaxID=553088 RepID=UPI00304B5B68
MRADYLALLPSLVRDDSGRLQPGDFELALTMAVARYSKDRPARPVSDAVVVARKIALPSDWTAGFSQLVAVEHPVGSIPPQLHDPATLIQVYQAPDGIELLALGLADGAQVRLTITTPHALSDLIDTIPALDQEPVCCWAAAILCDQLANAWANAGDSTIGADGSDNKTRSTEFANRARGLRRRYLDDVGVQQQRTDTASAVVAVQPTDSLGGPRLWHPARRRY